MNLFRIFLKTPEKFSDPIKVLKGLRNYASMYA